MLAQNRQSTNMHRQNQNSTSIRNITASIYYIHTSLRYKKARTTETAEVTWREHDVNIACDWSTPTPRPGPPQCSTVFARLEIGLARATPGTKKNTKLCTRLLKKNG